MNYALRHKGKPSEEKKKKERRKKKKKLIFAFLNFYNKLNSALILNIKR